MVNYSPQFQSFANSINKKYGVGFNYTTPPPSASQISPGQNLINNVTSRAQNAQQNYTTQNANNTQQLAQDVVSKSGGIVPTDQYGIPQTTMTNFSDIFNQQLQTTQQIGGIATQGAIEKNAWQQAKKLQDLQQYAIGYSSNDIPAGATPDNKGAQAVAIAMNVVKNKTPYVWGGNSLKGGVDCSGLVQQIYKQLGISIPRSTYEQAKSGHIVSQSQMMPGDLVFYNTGSSDPNGIGINSHVAIYIGNGKIIEAAHTGTDVKIDSLTDPGAVNVVVRPW